MEINLKDAVAILERTPAVLDVWLRGLPKDWTTQNEGGETWSPFDVVGHLIHGELTDWIPRMRRLIEHGESKPFDPFDRFAQFRESEGKSLEELLDRFAALRKNSLAALLALKLDDQAFAKTGRHQVLGTVTLGELLAAWVAHDLTHINQISRVMAHQYREAVGPWKQFMGVMKSGHVSG
ncbi:MAG TPA: DinB family protein [Terriglobales bacterium]|nr:DinB family protein [Terriglobales bacterium]